MKAEQLSPFKAAKYICLLIGVKRNISELFFFFPKYIDLFLSSA
jgi:hypothetical protein